MRNTPVPFFCAGVSGSVRLQPDLPGTCGADRFPPGVQILHPFLTERMAAGRSPTVRQCASLFPWQSGGRQQQSIQAAGGNAVGIAVSLVRDLRPVSDARQHYRGEEGGSHPAGISGRLRFRRPVKQPLASALVAPKMNWRGTEEGEVLRREEAASMCSTHPEEKGEIRPRDQMAGHDFRIAPLLALICFTEPFPPVRSTGSRILEFLHVSVDRGANI